MFKNYIHNELGITKDDIRAWLKEAVQSQAELMLKKTFDDFDMDTFVRRHIETQMRYWTTDSVRHQVANLLADRLVILSEDNEKINDSDKQNINPSLIFLYLKSLVVQRIFTLKIVIITTQTQKSPLY